MRKKLFYILSAVCFLGMIIIFGITIELIPGLQPNWDNLSLSIFTLPPLVMIWLFGLGVKKFSKSDKANIYSIIVSILIIIVGIYFYISIFLYNRNDPYYGAQFFLTPFYQVIGIAIYVIMFAVVEIIKRTSNAIASSES